MLKITLAPLRGVSTLLNPVSRLQLVVLDECEAPEIDSEMESAFNLLSHASILEELLRFYRKKYPAQWTLLVTQTNGSMWLSPLFALGWVCAVNLIQHTGGRLVFDIAGGFHVPPKYPQQALSQATLSYSLVCMDGLDVVGSSNAPANDTPSFFLVIASVLHVFASSFRSTVGNTSGQSVLCTNSRRGVRRSSGYPSRCLVQRPILVFTILSQLGRAQRSVSASQHCVGLCTFAAGCRRHLSSIFQEVYSEVQERDPIDVLAPMSGWVAELLIAVLLGSHGWC